MPGLSSYQLPVYAGSRGDTPPPSEVSEPLLASTSGVDGVSSLVLLHAVCTKPLQDVV